MSSQELNPTIRKARIMSVDIEDFHRLEDKVDKVVDALNKLVLVEERQSTQGIRIGELEKEVATLKAQIIINDRKVDQWINRGIGVWALAIVVWTLWLQFYPRR